MLRIIAYLFIVESLGFRIDDIKLEDVSTNIANSIADKYLTGCTILLQSNNATWKEQRRIFRIAKLLFKTYEYSKTIRIATFQQYWSHVSYRYNVNRCSKMLHIIYSVDDNTRSQLEKVGMGGPIWIMFLPNKTSTEDFLEFVNVPFDAFFLTVGLENEIGRVDLWESYRVTINHPLRISHFGFWTAEQGLVTDYDNGIYYRRNDLEGIKFNVGSLDNPPMTMFTRKPNGELDLDGYFAWIWKDLQKMLNFTSSYIKPREFATGSYNGKEWTGLIGMVLKKQVEVVVSEVTMVPERYEAIDFLRPLFTTRYQLFFKEPGTLIQWDGIFRPFSTEVWITIILSLIGTAVFLKTMHFVGIKFGFEDLKFREEFNTLRCFFVVMSAFLQQGNPLIPKSTTCRMIVIITYLISLLLVITYSATLTSFIAVHKPRRPFDSLETFLEDGTYSMEQIAGTAGYTYFSNSTDRVLQEIYEKHFPKIPDSELPESHLAALENVCTKPKVTHYGEYDITNIAAQNLSEEKGCRFLVLENPMGMVFLTIIVAKDSPYRKLFDFYLNKMNYQGILYRFQKQAMPLYGKPRKANFESVNGEQVLQIHFILFGGIIAAFIIMIVEMYLKKYGYRIDSNGHSKLFEGELRPKYNLM